MTIEEQNTHTEITVGADERYVITPATSDITVTAPLGHVLIESEHYNTLTTELQASQERVRELEEILADEKSLTKFQAQSTVRMQKELNAYKYLQKVMDYLSKQALENNNAE